MESLDEPDGQIPDGDGIQKPLPKDRKAGQELSGRETDRKAGE